MNLNKPVLCVCSIVAGAMFAQVCWGSLGKSFRADAQPVELSLTPEAVIGSHPDYLGDPAAPYTLVEFADYQCPPCKAADAKLPDLLSRFKGKLRFTFRNYPLPFHAQALPAALAAEGARRQGKFWPMHDALYRNQSILSPVEIEAVTSAVHLDRARLSRDSDIVKSALAEDKKIAEAFHLNSTPTFVLCGPARRVLQLHGLAQAEQYIR